MNIVLKQAYNKCMHRTFYSVRLLGRGQATLTQKPPTIKCSVMQALYAKNSEQRKLVPWPYSGKARRGAVSVQGKWPGFSWCAGS